MEMFPKLCFSLAALLVSLAAAANSGEIPAISIEDLRSAVAGGNKEAANSELLQGLRDPGGRFSAFAVTGLDGGGRGYSESLEKFRSTLGGCLKEREDLPDLRFQNMQTIICNKRPKFFKIE